ncbi:hypothetical protein TUSST3_64840 [Streptomyces sp. TUS-ST3]|nr:hypothetical protein TUSST3_64840 [Streptomyces sp. TUS-ST3]
MSRSGVLRQATTAVFEEEKSVEQDADSRARSGALNPSAVFAGLRVALAREHRRDLVSLLEGEELSLAPTFPVVRLLPASEALGERPVLGAFGPLGPEKQGRAMAEAGQKSGWFQEAVHPEAGEPSQWDVWVVYENDGTGIIPNFGSGSDQGRTAALYVSARRRTPVLGVTRIGLTPIEMITPRGRLSNSAANDSTSTYDTGAGPYHGIAAMDVGVTVAKGGFGSVELGLTAGVDSGAWGKLVQNFIHTKISDSPIFPWPTHAKPLVEAGVTWRHTLNEITSGEFQGLHYTGRIEIDASMVAGTRRTEGDLSARFVVRTTEIHTPLGLISLEFSPLGVLGRAFLRYNDGRMSPLAGGEAAVNSSIMVNLGRVGLGLLGEMLLSSDPAFQTGVEAGTHPTVTQAVGVVESGPAGHHGTGQLVLRISF